MDFLEQCAVSKVYFTVYLRKHAHCSVSSWAWRKSSFTLHAFLLIKGRIVFIPTVISAVGVYLERDRESRSIWNSQISLSLRHGNCSSSGCTTVERNVLSAKKVFVSFRNDNKPSKHYFGVKIQTEKGIMDIFNFDWTLKYWEFIWLIIRKVIHCLSLNRTRVLVLKFPWENKKGSCYVTTTMYMYSTELCPFIATSGPPSSVLLEYFRYYTRAHVLLFLLWLKARSLC